MSEQEENAKKIRKYEKKIAKTLRQLEASSDNSGDDDSTHAACRLKIENFQRLQIAKYQRKIAALTGGPVASAAGDIDKAADSSDAEAEATSSMPLHSSDKNNMSLLLFYAYVEPAWTHHRYNETLRWAETTLSGLGVTGRLRVAREGFNGTLTGSSEGIRGWTAALRDRDNGYFAHMNETDDFKITDNLPTGQAFPKLKVFPVTELVNYGLGIDGAPSTTQGGVHLPPREYHQKLLEDNTVVIDVRNSYEADIGRFAPKRGAEYIDPKVGAAVSVCKDTIASRLANRLVSRLANRLSCCVDTSF
jgi:hypothetical protein